MWLMISIQFLLNLTLNFNGSALNLLEYTLREQSLKMLQTGVEEFKIFLWKISYPNIKCYFGFIPQQKNGEKVNTPTTKKKVQLWKLATSKGMEVVNFLNKYKAMAPALITPYKLCAV